MDMSKQQARARARAGGSFYPLGTATLLSIFSSPRPVLGMMSAFNPSRHASVHVSSSPSKRLSLRHRQTWYRSSTPCPRLTSRPSVYGCVCSFGNLRRWCHGMWFSHVLLLLGLLLLLLLPAAVVVAAVHVNVKYNVNTLGTIIFHLPTHSAS